MAFGLEAVVTAEVEEPWVGSIGSNDDLAHVVVEDPPGPTTEEGDGVLMTADRGRQRHGAGELDVEEPRVTQHERVNRKRIQRLMRQMGLEAIYRKPNLSRAQAGQRVYPYLLRDLPVTIESQPWSLRQG